MREGLVPASASHIVRIPTVESIALRLGMLLGEMLDADEHAVAAFEAADGHDWLVEVFFTRPPDEPAFRNLIRLALPGPEGERLAGIAEFSEIAARDWIRASLDGLKPVRAGRFVIHGGHDRGQVGINEIGIEIEAALAFGTGHHGTTHGCLQALADTLKLRRPRRIIDVGTGTGVLAIAAALALRQRVTATDIDPVSTLAARDNAVLNRAGAFVRPLTAAGLRHPALAGRQHDLLLANILAKPLRRLAKDFAPAVTRGGEMILSGLLIPDVPGVLSAYAGQGFRLKRQTRREGWATLVLRRGGQAARPARPAARARSQSVVR